MLLSLLGRILTAATPAGAVTPVDSVPYPAPMRAETAAWLVPVDGGLRLFVNRAGRDTAQLDVVPGAPLSELPPVPLVTGGVAACGTGAVVAGFDPRGNRPAVVVLGKDGKVARQRACRRRRRGGRSRGARRSQSCSGRSGRARSWSPRSDPRT